MEFPGVVIKSNLIYGGDQEKLIYMEFPGVLMVLGFKVSDWCNTILLSF